VEVEEHHRGHPADPALRGVGRAPASEQQPRHQVHVALARTRHLPHRLRGEVAQVCEDVRPAQQLGEHPVQLLGVGHLDAAPAEQHLHAVAEVLHPRSEEHRPSLRRRLEDVLPALAG
jgi:hypothetical protein